MLRGIFKKFFLPVSLTTLVLSNSVVAQEKLPFDYATNNILYYEKCGGDVPAPKKSSGSFKLTYPDELDEDKMIQVIDEYIKEITPNSILLDTGKYMVASSKEANITPFLVIAHAQIESSIGRPGVSSFVDVANNSFGRSATPSQPRVPGNDIIWAYVWTSGKASVDHTAPENQKDNTSDFPRFIRTEYAEHVDSGNLDDYINKYVGGEGGGNISTYTKTFTDIIGKLTERSGGTASKGSKGSSSSAENVCCNEATAPVNSSMSLSGKDNAEKIFNYLTGKGLTAEQASGVLGNLLVESGGNLDTSAVNSASGASGLVQWTNDRKNRLFNVAERMGKDWTDLEVQVYFMGWEIGIEDDTEYLGRKPTHTHVGDELKNASSIEEATRIWLEKYEIPTLPGDPEHEKEYQNRLAKAQEVYAEFGDGGGSGPSRSTGRGGSTCNTSAEPAGDFVYYAQSDPKWQVDGLNMAFYGCGPTSIAMIAATLKDKSITPVDVAKHLASVKGWDQNVGLYHAPVVNAVKEWGLEATELGTDWELAKKELRAGKLLLIAGNGAEPLTEGGHVVVGRGITDDDRIIIANPGHNAVVNPESTTYDIPIPGVTQIWSFE